MTCTFELGTTLRDIPTVDVRLSDRTVPCSLGRFDLAVRFPEATGESGVYEFKGGPRTGMFCRSFEVSVEEELSSREKAESELQEAFDATVRVASLVADTIWAKQPTLGFAGGRPTLKGCSVVMEAQPVTVGFLGYKVKTMIVGWPMPTLADIETVLRDGVGPSISAVLLAQASNYAMANPSASKSAAVTLAAIACELSIKERLIEKATPEQAELVRLLIPERGSSRLSMVDLVKGAFLPVFGRSLRENNGDLWRRYISLIEARNAFAHRGEEFNEMVAWGHVNTAREVLEWIETI